MSDFADYVQKQQQEKRRPPGKPEEHEELSILDQLDLADEVKTIRLKEVFLNKEKAEDSRKQLSDYVQGRLDEGKGEAILDIGLEDSGESMKFSLDDWIFALKRMIDASADAQADVKILMVRNVGGELDVGPLSAKDTFSSGKVLVRRRIENVNEVIETRISVVGNVDAGKSTMLGVLVKGGLDDGRGKARVNLFRHKHEHESGRTSSVGMEIMGFDSKGDIITSSVPGRKLSWEEIGQRSVRHILVISCNH